MTSGSRTATTAAAAVRSGSDGRLPAAQAAATLPDPSAQLEQAFGAVVTRMAGLPIVNGALAVEAVGFAPWQGHWLGVLVTPWFMNLILAPRDRAAWQPLAQGEKRAYRFPAGIYDFIGASDPLAGEYQMCSLFSPVLQFDEQAAARMVAELARAALFDVANAEVSAVPVGNLSPPPDRDSAAPGPLAQLETALNTPQTKRDFLRGRWTGKDRDHRG